MDKKKTYTVFQNMVMPRKMSSKDRGIFFKLRTSRQVLRKRRGKRRGTSLLAPGDAEDCGSNDILEYCSEIY